MTTKRRYCEECDEETLHRENGDNWTCIECSAPSGLRSFGGDGR